jgi:hypothetical protein
MGPEGHGVVIGDAPLVLGAEDRFGIQGTGPGAMGGGRIGRGLSEACIEPREKPLEEGVGAFVIADLGEAELGAEASLERAKEPLDTALGLREEAAIQRMPSSYKARPTCVGAGPPCNCSGSVNGRCGSRWKIPWRSL